MNLGTNHGRLQEEWGKVHEDEYGWMKLVQVSSGLVLQLGEDGKTLSLNKNLQPPCQGRKPCLRYNGKVPGRGR